MLKIMDAKGNGTISYEEFSQFHKLFHIEQEMIDKFYKSNDTNGDGVIDYQDTCANSFSQLTPYNFENRLLT